MNVQVKKREVQKRIHFPLIDSTNNWAKAHSQRWSATGVTLITASEQTAGRGLFKRTWVSPPDVNIYATFSFWLDSKREDVGHIPQLMALAAALALEDRGYFPKIKWPNDLLLNKKKVAGILCETITEGDVKGIVCGIGLNVNMTPDLIQGIDRPATSLFIERGLKENVENMLELLTDHFLTMLEKFIASGFEAFFPLIQQRSFLLKGDPVQFDDRKNKFSAQFEALHPRGGVELRFQDGSKKLFQSGEFINIY